MYLQIGKILLSALIITFVSWLSGKKTFLAGFITALPLTSLIALAFGQMEFSDAKQSVVFAKSIFYAIPLSLTFFLPFLLAEKLNLNFWTCYVSGICLLGISYFIHQSLAN